jgi:hypothetical protein
MNATELKALVSQAQDVVKSATLAADVRKYWTDSLDNVTLDNWAINPWGYVLKGIAKGTRRNPVSVLKLFKLGMEAPFNLKSNLEAQARKPETAFARKCMELGLFASFARKASQYGSAEARLTGDKVAKLGNVKARKAGAELVQGMEIALQDNLNAKAFETSQTIDMIIAKYGKPAVKPVAEKPAVKPVAEKPAVKPVTEKKARKA